MKENITIRNIVPFVLKMVAVVIIAVYGICLISFLVGYLLGVDSILFDYRSILSNFLLIFTLMFSLEFFTFLLMIIGIISISFLISILIFCVFRPLASGDDEAFMLSLLFSFFVIILIIVGAN